jgi:hypothetical protein
MSFFEVGCSGRLGHLIIMAWNGGTELDGRAGHLMARTRAPDAVGLMSLSWLTQVKAPRRKRRR